MALIDAPIISEHNHSQRDADRFDAAGYSIPTLCDLLNDDEVIGALKQELFFVILEGHFAYGPPREAEMKLRVSRLRDGGCGG